MLTDAMCQRSATVPPPSSVTLEETPLSKTDSDTPHLPFAPRPFSHLGSRDRLYFQAPNDNVRGLHNWWRRALWSIYPTPWAPLCGCA